MTVKIQRADEVADFLSCLADIDDIFFTSSARRDFSSQKEKQAFRDVSLGRYIERHRSSFFVALNDAGGAVGYLAGCLENPRTLNHFVPASDSTQSKSDVVPAVPGQTGRASSGASSGQVVVSDVVPTVPGQTGRAPIRFRHSQPAWISIASRHCT